MDLCKIYLNKYEGGDFYGFTYLQRITFLLKLDCLSPVLNTFLNKRKLDFIFPKFLLP